MEQKETKIEEDLQGVKDGEMSEVTGDKMLETLYSDLSTIEHQIERIKKEEKNYGDQYEIDKEIWNIMLKPGNYKKLNPDYGFEQDEEYWKFQEKKQAYKVRESVAVGDGQMAQYVVQLEELNKRLKTTKAKIKAVKDSKVEGDE